MGLSVMMDALNTQAEILHRFANLFADAAQIDRDYETGDGISMPAVQFLCAIVDHPGISGVQLADRFACTPSAVSQILKWLESHGYIRRESHQEHGKGKQNFPTERGEQLCEAHRRTDASVLVEVHKCLLRNCSTDEIAAFYRVMHSFNGIMAAELRKQLRRRQEMSLKTQRASNHIAHQEENLQSNIEEE